MEVRQANNFNYAPQFKFKEGDLDLGCQSQQEAIMTCMKSQEEKGQGTSKSTSKSSSSSDCYLPAISAWNECVAKGVGYL